MNRREMLLTQLSEECAEVIQEISKTLRFGEYEMMPGQPLTNVERIQVELNDLMAMIEMLKAEGVFGITFRDAWIEEKKQKVEKFLTYSKECGTLDNETNFSIGKQFYVYDRYRFAIPIKGVIKAFSTSNDGVELTLLESNNAHYPVGSDVWVHRTQLRLEK